MFDQIDDLDQRSPPECNSRVILVCRWRCVGIGTINRTGRLIECLESITPNGLIMIGCTIPVKMNANLTTIAYITLIIDRSRQGSSDVRDGIRSGPIFKEFISRIRV